MIISEEDYLAHYGILRRSGRYPWGSGGSQNTRNRMFLDYVDDLKRQGLTEVQIVEGLGLESTTQLRAAKSIAKTQLKQADIAMAQRLHEKGYSNVAIGQRMGKPESTVRSLLADGQKDKADILQATSEMLRGQVAEKTFVDIGTGVENHIGVSSTKLSTAVAVLKEEGYEVHTVPVEQLGTGQNTKVKVLAPPGTTWGEVMRNRDKIQQVVSFSEDGGRTFLGIHPPLSISADRVGIRYAEDGGTAADGVIYVRPGVADISLGNSRYAQVRIQVGDGHYLKGMAMYKDDLPDGVDLVFNTNKSDTGNKLDAMKPVTGDKDNPFGAQISRQLVTKDASGKERVTSAMNIVNEEGDWANWSKSLSTQMLSKQSPSLAKSQLDMTFERRQKEFDEIVRLTNPTVRKKLLLGFADGADAASVHLKAAALPRQGSHVILPIDSMPPSQVYAPNYRDGERVVLIRYPHGGRFEIPELTVNNSQAEAKRLLGDARDAIGIHHSVAERLSGADFDGDTVLVIPNNSGRVKTAPALDGLKNFDPRSMYKLPPDSPIKRMTSVEKQTQMGYVSNLITDMTIRGASSSELARAVRHSMVVIDAEKHNLNFRQSAIDNGIPQLMEKYQGRSQGGAATLISRSGQNAQARVPERTPRPARDGGPIDKETGKLVFKETGATYTNKDGKVVVKTTKAPRLSLVDDANQLSSGTPIERLYADHSNKLKALANQARRDAVNTMPSRYSPSAAKTYEKEVRSLNAKLEVAIRNRPLERQAQIIANTTVRMKRDAHPDMDQATLKKVKAQALNEARLRTGAKKEQITITAREWDAIQARAISENRLSQILDNADIDVVKELATPRTQVLMTSAKTTRARQMLASGYTRAEVADALGVSLTTLDLATTAEQSAIPSTSTNTEPVVLIEDDVEDSDDESTTDSILMDEEDSDLFESEGEIT